MYLVYAEESAKVTNLSDQGKVRSDNYMSSCFVEMKPFSVQSFRAISLFFLYIMIWKEGFSFI